MFLPILVWEMRQAFRQPWFHNVRRLYALLAVSFFVWYHLDLSFFRATNANTVWLRSFVWLTTDYRAYLPVTQLLAVLMLAPILGVVGIMQAKNQRRIELLLTTRQTAVEVVLGLWLSGWLKLVCVLAPTVPLGLWLHGLFGWPWWSPIVSFLSIMALALPLTAWAVLAGVLLRRTAGAALAAFAGSAVLWVALLVTFQDRELVLLVAPAWVIHVWLRLGLLVALPTLLFLVMAAWRLRPALSKQAQHTAVKSLEWPRPPVGDEPIYWRAYFLHDWIMLRTTRRVSYRVRIGLFILATCLVSFSPASALDLTPHCEMILIGVGFPLAALAWAGSAVSTEREMGTWDPLRTSALSGDEIFEQTLRAILPRLRVYWLALLPAVVILTCKRHATAPFVPFVWLLAGASIYPACVIGLYHSVRADRAARSILTAIFALSVIIALPAFVGLMISTVLVGFLETVWDTRILYVPLLNYHSLSYAALLVIAIPTLVASVFLQAAARYHRYATLASLSEHENVTQPMRDHALPV